MIYRILGRTKLKVSVIGFGGGPLQVVTPKEATFLIDYAIKKGINIADIDKVHKKNEEKLGDALASKRDNMYIMAKSFAPTKFMMDKAISGSLSKLKTDYIDIYQMHLVRNKKDLDKRLKGSLLSLKKAKSRGDINFIGITAHHVPTLIEAIKTNEFDTVLVPYNIGHKLAEKELFDIAKNYNTGIIAMKPLGGGFLIDPKFPDEEPFERAKDMTAENALKFILSNKSISCALVGFNRKEHIDEAAIVGNKDIHFTRSKINDINNKVLEFLGDDYCRNCRYCLPCEGTNGKLEIDKILRLYAYYTKYGYKNSSKKKYSELKVKGDSCVACMKCIPKCPYNLNIPQIISKAHIILSITKSDLMKWYTKDFKEHDLNELKEKFIEERIKFYENKEKIKKHTEKIKKLKKELLTKKKELEDKENKVWQLNEKLRDKEKELYRIYNSKTYKYFVSKLWDVYNSTKNRFKNKVK